MAVPLARSPVHEMIKETVLVRHGVAQKAKRHTGALKGRAGTHPSAPVGNAKPAEAKTRGGDAGNGRFVELGMVGAVHRQARFRVGALPEKSETGVFQFLEKGVVPG